MPKGTYKDCFLIRPFGVLKMGTDGQVQAAIVLHTSSRLDTAPHTHSSDRDSSKHTNAASLMSLHQVIVVPGAMPPEGGMFDREFNAASTQSSCFLASAHLHCDQSRYQMPYCSISASIT